MENPPERVLKPRNRDSYAPSAVGVRLDLAQSNARIDRGAHGLVHRFHSTGRETLGSVRWIATWGQFSTSETKGPMVYSEQSKTILEILLWAGRFD